MTIVAKWYRSPTTEVKLKSRYQETKTSLPVQRPLKAMDTGLNFADRQ
jgi:hypothetical protein